MNIKIIQKTMEENRILSQISSLPIVDNNQSVFWFTYSIKKKDKEVEFFVASLYKLTVDGIVSEVVLDEKIIISLGEIGQLCEPEWREDDYYEMIKEINSTIDLDEMYQCIRRTTVEPLQKIYKEVIEKYIN